MFLFCVLFLVPFLKTTMCSITEIYGDLFVHCPPHVPLAHCVSVDLHMSKGIAKIFKSRYGNVPFLKNQIQSVGQCATLNYQGRYLFYLATKRRFFHKPTYGSLAQSLRSLRFNMESLGLFQLGIPKISTGLDALEWLRVKEIIRDVFTGSHIEIYVFYL